MKIHDHGRNRLLTALKTLLLCFGYWMRSGLDVLVGLRGGNMLTSAETLDTFEKLWVEIVGDFKSSYHKLPHFLKKKTNLSSTFIVFHVAVAQTTERTECRSERGVFPVSTLQPEKALEKKHVWTECYSTQRGGIFTQTWQPFPSLSLNKQPANTWMAAQIWQLMYSLFLDAGEARCTFWGMMTPKHGNANEGCCLFSTLHV